MRKYLNTYMETFEGINPKPIRYIVAVYGLLVGIPAAALILVGEGVEQIMLKFHSNKD